MHHTGTVSCVGIVMIAAPASIMADDKTVEFDDYSRAAERAVDQLLLSIARLKTYRDDAVIEMKTGMAFGQDAQEVGFAYAKPNRLHIRTNDHEVVSDGKELTVYVKGMRRYKTAPLEKDIGKQIEQYVGGGRMGFGVSEMFTAANPRKWFAKRFKGLEITGRETIDDERCIVLEGMLETDAMGMVDTDAPVVIYLRESDGLIRRVEVDMLDAIKAQFGGGDDDDDESETPTFFPFKEYTVVYDVVDIEVNQAIDESEFTFDAPSGAKKVDEFFGGRWRHVGDTASRFELSGKEAPDFELESVDGESITLSALRGRIVVLDFLFAGFGRGGRGGTMQLDMLDEVRRDYEAKGVTLLAIYPDSSADSLVERLSEAGIEITVVLDPDRSATSEYFSEAFASGIVLVGKDGVVQGRYAGFLTADTAKTLRSDLDKLIEGKALAGAKPMTEEEIDEATDQRAARFGGATAEALNEESLDEAWSVKANASAAISFGVGGGGTVTSSDGAMWVKHKRTLRRVSASGEVTAEVTMPHYPTDQFGQSRTVVGRVGRGLGIVHMATIPGEEETMGWRPPKGVKLTASDESGDEVWTLEFDVKNQQVPRHLALANLDGRGDDELVFVHEGAVWIIDETGDVVARKPMVGRVQWLKVEDRDRDRRAEIYVRTPTKLIRYDYRPPR
ncbi:MAG: redoxin domain-containing protein [Planctomycetes bacterium]|nr:redoxin domain-containing protein [Planctomycetota bacterium]